jgi:hypothetical protein
MKMFYLLHGVANALVENIACSWKSFVTAALLTGESYNFIFASGCM